MEWPCEVQPAVCLALFQGWQGAVAQGRSNHSKHGVMFPLAHPTSFQKFEPEGLLDPELVSMCLIAITVCFFQEFVQLLFESVCFLLLGQKPNKCVVTLPYFRGFELALLAVLGAVLRAGMTLTERPQSD